MSRFTYFILSVLLLSACKKPSTPTSIDFGKNYYPITIGKYVVYDVDSIVHDDNDDGAGVIDTFRYQIKETIDSVFTDLSGKENYRLIRHTRDSVNDSWRIKDVWYVHSNNSRVEQVEENNRFIKLVFPVKEGEEWEGNAYNTLTPRQYEYTEVDIQDTINSITLDSVCHVLQYDDVNFIETEHAEERYARSIGKVYKEYTFIDIQNQAGIEYYERYSSHGIN